MNAIARTMVLAAALQSFVSAQAVAGDDAVEAAPSATLRLSPSAVRTPGTVAVAVGAMYGHSAGLVGQSDVHHRAAGALLLEASPLSWLGLGVRLDGRYDRHRLDDGSTDDGWIGEPRVHVQIDHGFSPAWTGAVRAALSVPGGSAPSLRPAASTVDGTAQLTFAPSSSVRLTALAGYRLDRSAASIDDADALGPGDRSALMLSSYDAALVGLGALWRHGRIELRGEWSADLLLGAGAPGAGSSPMRVGAGLRAWLAQGWGIELGSEVLTSGRAAIPMTGPLVPLPPRFAVLAGAVATFGAAPARPRAPASEAIPAADEKPASVRGRLLTGGRLPRGVQVFVVARPGAEPQRVDVDDDGTFSAEGLPAGLVEFTAEAPGWSVARQQVSLRPGVIAALKMKLERTQPSGQIRGLVRSFTGKPVVAVVRIVARKPAGAPARELRSDEGKFSLEVVPGAYTVTVEAPGYASQVRAVSVEDDGVTVLNVDLRRGRP